MNESDDPVKLKIRPVPPDPNITPQLGYEYAPDPGWLIVKPEEIAIKGNSIRELKLRLAIPDEPAYRGKKYMFLIQTTLADERLPLIYSNTLYVDTLP